MLRTCGQVPLWASADGAGEGSRLKGRSGVAAVMLGGGGWLCQKAAVMAPGELAALLADQAAVWLGGCGD